MSEEKKPDKCVLCQLTIMGLDGDVTTYSDGSRAHTFCWEKLQEYKMDLASERQDEAEHE